MPPLLTSNQAKVLSGLLILQAVAFHLIPKDEVVPPNRPFREFPVEVAGWKMIAEHPLEEEVEELLKADDTLNRLYVDPTGEGTASFFLAFFRSQRAGVSPHSPRVCLPGSGWEAREARSIAVALPERAEPALVNRYIVARDMHRSLVLYWYQSRDRIVADEYAAKLYLMLDAVRYRRSDTALVRIVTPVTDRGVTVAESLAVRMALDFYPQLREFLPR